MPNRPARNMRGLVFDVDRFAIHDGPGIRTTVFLKGCPLHCWWCHSPESQLGRPQLLYMQGKCTGCSLCLETCPTGAITLDGDRAAINWANCTDCGACTDVCYPGALKLSGEWETVSEVVEEVAKDAIFYHRSGGGVTLTGGEVAQQGSFAVELLRACRERGIHTAVETAGLAPWRVYAQLAEVTDLFLFDLKHMDSGRHRALTGAPNELILRNLRRLAAGAAPAAAPRGTAGHSAAHVPGTGGTPARPHTGAQPPGDGDPDNDSTGAAPRSIHQTTQRATQRAGYTITVRVPCIPGLNDTDENIHATAAFVRDTGLTSIHLLPYNASAAAKYAWIGRPYLLDGLTTQSAEHMQRLAGICAAHGLPVQIGG